MIISLYLKCSPAKDHNVGRKTMRLLVLICALLFVVGLADTSEPANKEVVKMTREEICGGCKKVLGRRLEYRC